MTDREKIRGGDVDIDVLRSDEELTNEEIGDNCANLSATIYKVACDVAEGVFNIADEYVRYETVVIVIGVKNGQIVGTEGRFAADAPRQVLAQMIEAFATRVKYPGMHDAIETRN